MTSFFLLLTLAPAQSQPVNGEFIVRMAASQAIIPMFHSTDDLPPEVVTVFIEALRATRNSSD